MAGREGITSYNIWGDVCPSQRDHHSPAGPGGGHCSCWNWGRGCSTTLYCCHHPNALLGKRAAGYCNDSNSGNKKIKRKCSSSMLVDTPHFYELFYRRCWRHRHLTWSKRNLNSIFHGASRCCACPLRWMRFVIEWVTANWKFSSAGSTADVLLFPPRTLCFLRQKKNLPNKNHITFKRIFINI